MGYYYPVNEIHALYIEDDQDDQAIMRDYLGDLDNVQVRLTACNGTAAAESILSATSGHAPDVLIVDNRMPPTDKYVTGSNFLNHLVLAGNDIPKILASGAAPELLHAETQNLISSGAIHFLHKEAITPPLLASILIEVTQKSADVAPPSAAQKFSRPVTPYGGFAEASQGLIERLQRKHGFGLVMMTRRQGKDWLVLQAADRDYGIKAGDLLRWSDSFCALMVEDHGPMFTNNKDEVPLYRDSNVADQLPITSYLGIPICRGSGELFGTLCAIDPQPLDKNISRDLPELMEECRFLATILENELLAETLLREKKRAEFDSMTDGPTGLYNRRGWDLLLQAEEGRCKRYGHPSAVIVIDLDGLKKVNDEQGHDAGDALIQKAAQALAETIRSEDIAARLGGDEFAVLAVETAEDSAQQLLERLEAALASSGVAASLGVSSRTAARSLVDATKQADENMYLQKKQRKSA